MYYFMDDNLVNYRMQLSETNHNMVTMKMHGTFSL